MSQSNSFDLDLESHLVHQIYYFYIKSTVNLETPIQQQ